MLAAAELTCATRRTKRWFQTLALSRLLLQSRLRWQRANTQYIDATNSMAYQEHPFGAADEATSVRAVSDTPARCAAPSGGSRPWSCRTP